MADTMHFQPLPPFDELVALAKENPAAFSMLKQDICEEVILSASSTVQDHLWALQSHIDRVVTTCKKPELINARLMSELSNQVFRFHDTLGGEDQTKPIHSAEVIPFPS